jgi:DNA/RNA-binding domain of Phe-tRNA-synthetase-like protein
MTELFAVTEAWRAAWPGAAAGVLAMRDVTNPPGHPALERCVAAREAALRARLAGADRAALRALPALQAYAAYYRRWGKTYHVQLQLESVARKGRPITRASALVTAMVTAELEHLLLTAGHDLDRVAPPVTLTVAVGGERYVLPGGREQALQAGDMAMADRQGIVSSILHGPDARTWLGPDTRRVLFAVYAPRGIGGPAVTAHLEDLAAMVRLVSPHAAIETLAVHEAPEETPPATPS